MSGKSTIISRFFTFQTRPPELNGEAVRVTVLGVAQDEPQNGTGDGDICPDAVGAGTAKASVRAERSGQGDAHGETCEGEVRRVCAADGGRQCVDQGALFDSTACR